MAEVYQSDTHQTTPHRFAAVRVFPFGAVFLVAAFLLTGARVASAASASMFLTPATGSFTVGRNFSVAVRLNTAAGAINAAEGSLSFDPQRLAVVGISKSGSIFSLWTKEPAVSGQGTVEFGGGVPNPGFTGSAGAIITITFRAEEPGDTSLNFISGAVLANDGKGTNVLSSLGGSTYSIIPSSLAPPRVPEPVTTPRGAPGAPAVHSTTHPDPEGWYRERIAVFEWPLPQGVTAVSLGVGRIAVVLPIVTYEPPISRKVIDDLEDGVWYFHAQFRNARGVGPVIHVPFRIDTIPPESFGVIVDNGGDPTNPAPLLRFSTTDQLSGVSHYEVRIGNGDLFVLPADAVASRRPYQMPLQAPGQHRVIISAVDRAGNSASASADVIIEPIPAPVITDYPRRLDQGGQLIVTGTSLPQVTVLVTVHGEAGDAVQGETTSNGNGAWQYVHPRIFNRGSYVLIAQARDARGAESLSSPPAAFDVALPFALNVGQFTLDYFTLLVALSVFTVVAFAGRHYFITWRRRLRKEVREVEASLHQAFRALSEDIQEQFDALQKLKTKRALTKGERRILTQLKEHLKISEKFLSKEFEDVEKELE